MGLSFACKDVGITDCKMVAKADTAEELLAAVATHATHAHGVELNQTLIDFALTKVKPTK